MSGRHKWDDVVARQYPELVQARFPKGTKARIQALADQSMLDLAAKNPDELDQVPVLLSPSVIVRRAVLQYLDREGV